MLIYKCDACGIEMSASETRSDAWQTAPEGWITTRLRVHGVKRVKVHLCSFDCVKAFDPAEFWRKLNSGFLTIKRLRPPGDKNKPPEIET